MYVNKIKNAYPYSALQLKQDNPQVSFPKDMPDSLLATWGVYPVKSSNPPYFNSLTHKLVEGTPIESDGEWLQQWAIIPLSKDEVLTNISQVQDNLRIQIVAEAQERLDSFARTRNYDGILSACTYATSNVPKFAAEGQVAVNLRDATWAALYQILEEIQAGQREAPSGFSDIEPLLPPLEWPV